MQKFKYIYGPVSSWRLGISLGIDLLFHKKKICNFNCLYCQIGETEKYTWERKVYVHKKKILEEIKRLQELPIDYVTLSGNGEPTLAKNIGDIIRTIKAHTAFPVATITNSTLLCDEEVRNDLYHVDYVIAKLDAHDASLFKAINRPCEEIKFEDIVDGIREFKESFKGKFTLQVMFVEQNIKYAEQIASLVNEINPYEVQINTPLRPSRCSPLPFEEIKQLIGLFKSPVIKNVYEGIKKDVRPISNEDTLRRRGKTT